MSTPEPAATAALSIPTVPVICDKCRAEGRAGDAAFGEVEGILHFTPVPRPAHANAWNAERQRAFIAALAITGSLAAAAASVGRHPSGVDKLRKARGARSFAQAWDAAIEIAQDRELARLKDDMAELARARDAGEALYEGKLPAEVAWNPAEPEPDLQWGSPEAIAQDERERRDHEEAQERIRERLLHARRVYLDIISTDGEARAAWETLVGPVDWEKAQKLEPQDNEPFRVLMRNPDMLLPVEAGLLPDLTGGPDFMAQVLDELRAMRMEGEAEPPSAEE